VVEQVGVGGQDHSGRIADAADLDRLLDQAGLGVGQHRAAAHDLVDGRRQVLLVGVLIVYLLDQTSLHCRLAGQLCKRPCQLRGGCLVPGDQRRHQLVAQLRWAHRRAVVVLGGQQQREHVSAARAFPLAFLDQREDQLVGLCPCPF